MDKAQKQMNGKEKKRLDVLNGKVEVLNARVRINSWILGYLVAVNTALIIAILSKIL